MSDTDGSWQNNQQATQQQAQIDAQKHIVRDLTNVPAVVRENYTAAQKPPT